MAIGYTNPTWTNGSGSAINATNLNAISNALATVSSCCDNGAATITPIKIYNDKNVGTNWGTALIATLGTNWITALGATLGTGWSQMLTGTGTGVALPATWITALSNPATSGTTNLIDANTLRGIVLSSTPGAVTTGSVTAPTPYLIPTGAYYFYIESGQTIGNTIEFQIYANSTWNSVATATCEVTGKNGFANGIVISDGTNFRFYNAGAWTLIKMA
jgi:hypothetical protein